MAGIIITMVLMLYAIYIILVIRYCDSNERKRSSGKAMMKASRKSSISRRRIKSLRRKTPRKGGPVAYD